MTRMFRAAPIIPALLVTGMTACAQSFTVEPAPEWSALFDRDRGWTGADGIFSIPLSGDDSVGSAARTPTMFLFSDTAIGDVNHLGRRLPGSTLVNNTMALLEGAAPDPDRISFLTRVDRNGDPRAVFIPDTPNAEPGDWYWFGDGFINEADGGARLFAYRMTEGNGGVFNFATGGVAVITLPPGARPPFRNAIQVEAPLFIAPSDERGEVTFGAGVFVNTEAAGAPDPDGYIYVYGVQNDLSKKLLAARVRPDAFDDFSAWRFWNGVDWVADLESSAPITGFVSNELSVTPMPDGKYLLVFQFAALSRDVGVRIGDSPVGPYGPARRIYTCPEPSFDPEIFVYNAKAHPHLSRPGELLISYNVNTFDFFGDFFEYADIYRPRFIRLSWQ